MGLLSTGTTNLFFSKENTNISYLGWLYVKNYSYIYLTMSETVILLDCVLLVMPDYCCHKLINLLNVENV
jgi:hypothetical protein